MTSPSQDEIWNAIVDALRELLAEQDQELGDVAPDMLIGRDLGVSSIDIIHLMVTLEDRVNRPLDFNKLATSGDGELRRDLALSELRDFILAQGANPAAAQPGG